MSYGPLDGNAIAGDLSDFFAFDTTTAITTCAMCSDTHPIASLRAYACAPGIVLRCASCDAVQIRLVCAPRRAWLDVRGINMLTIPDAGGPATTEMAASPPSEGAR